MCRSIVSSRAGAEIRNIRQLIKGWYRSDPAETLSTAEDNGRSWYDSQSFDLVLLGSWAVFTLISCLNVSNDPAADLLVVAAYATLTVWWAPRVVRRLIDLRRERW